jgi:hypothetical protein
MYARWFAVGTYRVQEPDAGNFDSPIVFGSENQKVTLRRAGEVMVQSDTECAVLNFFVRP